MDTDLHHLLRSNQPLTDDHCQVLQCCVVVCFLFPFFTSEHQIQYVCKLNLVTWLLTFPVAVFRLPAAPGTQVCTLGKRLAQRPQAEQPAAECQMWPQDWRLWPGKDHNWNWLHDGVRRYTVVQSAWTPAQLLRVYSGDWYVVGRLHLRWNGHKRAFVSWEGLCSSAFANNWGTVHSPRVCFHSPLFGQLPDPFRWREI